ncbi:TolC family outer membrane protein [Geminicoccaceae bacterium 1502E]|nr:TolC family outer membrane protein [Geminicoccaceae bacterium 1502E]
MLWRHLVLPVLLAVLPPAAADAARLEEALALAYAASPELEAARARLRAVDENVPRARAGWFPAFDASSSAGFASRSGLDGAETFSTSRHALTLRQELYSGGETRALVRRAESAVLAERARLARVEQEVLLEVVAAYTAVLRDQALLELALSNEARLRQQREATGERFRLGQVTRTDVAQAETRHARASADATRAKGALTVSQADYEKVVGTPPERLVPVAVPAGLVASESEARAAAQSHPAVLAAQYGLDQAEDETAVARAALKPRLSLTGQAGYVDDPASGTGGLQQDMSVAAVLTVPLYQGGGDHARVRQSRQSAAQRGHELDAAVRAAGRDAVAAWRSLASLQARMDALETQARSAELAVEGVRQEALAGLRSVIDVLDAEQELVEARATLVEAGREEMLAAFALLAATGRLSAQSLELPVVLYEPGDHYRAVRNRWFGTGEPEYDTETAQDEDGR